MSKLISAYYIYIHPVTLLLLALIYHFSVKDYVCIQRQVDMFSNKKNLQFTFIPVLQFWVILYVLSFLV